MSSFARATFLTVLASAGAVVLAMAPRPASANDLMAQTIAGFRYPERPTVVGRPVPDCAETRQNHLLACAPREIVLILPDEPLANSVYTLPPPRLQRPYHQLFMWGP